MLDRDQAQELCARALSFASGNQAEIRIDDTSQALTRIANSAIHQNVGLSDITLSLRIDRDRRSGRASTNRLDDASLKRLVQDAIAAAKSLSGPQELPPMAGPQSYSGVKGLDPSTAQVDPEARADMVEQAVSLARTKDVLLAGLVSNQCNARAQANSNGLFAYHVESSIEMELTAMKDGSAGRASTRARERSGIDPEQVAGTAIAKCLGGIDPRAIDPGDYTVILEPEAVTTPLTFLSYLSFGALSVQENLSCLSGRLGQKLLGGNITIVDDAYHPMMVGAEPFDHEGLPRQRVVIIDQGVVRSPVYDQITAARDGKQSTGHGLTQPNTYGPMPSNLVLEGGQAPLNEMIRSTKRGILVTRFWYNRVVDRKVPVITGMTRDGTFLIEDGRVACGIKNMRFNQDLVEFFNNVELLGPQEGRGNMVVPALKAHGFRFTGRTG